MSTEICIKTRTILRTSPGVFEELYYTFEKIINNKKIILNSEINNLMNEMKINSEYCSYFWIDHFITKPESIHILLNILEAAINKLKKDLPERTITSLWNFYKELMVRGF